MYLYMDRVTVFFIRCHYYLVVFLFYSYIYIYLLVLFFFVFFLLAVNFFFRCARYKVLFLFFSRSWWTDPNQPTKKRRFWNGIIEYRKLYFYLLASSCRINICIQERVYTPVCVYIYIHNTMVTAKHWHLFSFLQCHGISIWFRFTAGFSPPARYIGTPFH